MDPHTYPGRPWPLSTLTVKHTDLYLQRAFFSVQKVLEPDSVLFLGDLFDGGREWATGKDQNPDFQWNRYGRQFWLKEYARFGRIFLDIWISAGPNPLRKQTRKFIASLPGNHDLGIGNGIRLAVRDRFTTFFGEGNRVDIIGNHSFVSIDTVSLSAKGQPQSELTGHDNQKAPNAEIWESPLNFLSHVKQRKALVMERELRTRSGLPELSLRDHAVTELTEPLQDSPQSPSGHNTAELPTVLLTHVPLYRSPGTPCGPLRERWPPSKNKGGTEDLLEKDERNAISVTAGYQYQNVLQADISEELIEKIGNVQHVFSGDDHDYCEVVHYGFTSKGGGVREITVKSMSWAMGIRKPGFLMVSLWNPIDGKGNAITTPDDTKDGTSVTVQTHLCLLPDQMSVFIRYAGLLVMTIGILILRSIAYGLGFWDRRKFVDGYDTFIKRSSMTAPIGQQMNRVDSRFGSTSSKSLLEVDHNTLAVRSSAGRTRSISPANGYGISMGLDRLDPAKGNIPELLDDNKEYHARDSKGGLWSWGNSRRGVPAVWHELKQSILQVASLPLLWYAWLAYTS